MPDRPLLPGPGEGDVPRKTALVDTPAHERAAMRLLRAKGSIYQAFDRLGCGFDHDAALEYLNASPAFQSFDEDRRGLVAGLCMGFALTTVESDRGGRDAG